MDRLPWAVCAVCPLHSREIAFDFTRSSSPRQPQSSWFTRNKTFPLICAFALFNDAVLLLARATAEPIRECVTRVWSVFTRPEVDEAHRGGNHRRVLPPERRFAPGAGESKRHLQTTRAPQLSYRAPPPSPRVATSDVSFGFEEPVTGRRPLRVRATRRGRSGSHSCFCADIGVEAGESSAALLGSCCSVRNAAERT